jgi:ribonuclease P protein component
LLKPDEYRRVFSGNQRSVDRYFMVLASPNDLGIPRLGLAISKKYARRAVDRNRLKRLVRESFRHHACQLAGMDLVVLNRKSDLTDHNSHYFDSLARHWQRLAKKCACY